MRAILRPLVRLAFSRELRTAEIHLLRLAIAALAAYVGVELS